MVDVSDAEKLWRVKVALLGLDRGKWDAAWAIELIRIALHQEAVSDDEIAGAIDLAGRCVQRPADEGGDVSWQPMITAPRDGTPIQADIPGHGTNNVIAWQDGFVDADDRNCGCWVMAEDQEPPDSWTDGVCWAVNEDGVPSVQPTRWRPLQGPIPRSIVERVASRALRKSVEVVHKAAADGRGK